MLNDKKKDKFVIGESSQKAWNLYGKVMDIL